MLIWNNFVTSVNVLLAYVNTVFMDHVSLISLPSSDGHDLMI